ncbi:MAG: helix-turn-helix transcriptional regulator [Acholeplasma sp.]|nr:helix-turn-helix transcriptional regulator [Acholeplasma sp.]
MKNHNNIRVLRQKRKLTLRELADRTNLNNGNLSRMERGLLGVPSETAMILADFFNVSVGYILGYENQTISNAIQAEKIPVYSKIYGGSYIFREDCFVGYQVAPASEDLTDCIYLVSDKDYKNEGIFKDDLLMVRLNTAVAPGVHVCANDNEPGGVYRIVELNKEWILLADNMPSKLDKQVLGQVLMVSRIIK